MLRSVKGLEGYSIKAKDGTIGSVRDFFFDDQQWTIRYLVVDTCNWLPGKKVLVPIQWITEVDWAGSKVHVDLTRETLKNYPEYDPSSPVNRETEEIIYDYYGRPKYWT
ncbi:MAG: PRC-barrel domain-containing protein [bacterium]